MSEVNFTYPERSSIGLAAKLMYVFVGILLCCASVFAGYLYGTRYDPAVFSLKQINGVRDFLVCCFDELKFFAAVFFAGFTLFAPAAASMVLLWRSAEFGCALYLFMANMKGETLVYDSPALVSLVVSSASLVLLLVTAAASVIHARSLRYAVPDIRRLNEYSETQGFVRAFIAVAAVIILLLLVKVCSVELLM